METEPPVIDNLHAERVERESFPTPTTSGGFVRFSMGADDFMAQEPNNESMWLFPFCYDILISFK